MVATLHSIWWCRPGARWHTGRAYCRQHHQIFSANDSGPRLALRQIDADMIRKFNQLIETCFRQYWTLAQYAGALSLTDIRLNDICRRIVNLSAKHPPP